MERGRPLLRIEASVSREVICRSPSSAAASAACRPPVPAARPDSTSRSTSRRGRSRRSAPASRSARTRRALAPPGPGRRARRAACGRRPSTSGAGTTAAPCSARRSATPIEAAFGAPYYHFHRADLLPALAAALPAERLHVGHRLDRLHRPWRPRRAALRERRAVAADVLVGADGIHSTVRAAAVRAGASRASPAASPSAGWCRPSGSDISISRSRRTTGWARAAISCTTASPAGGW